MKNESHNYETGSLVKQYYQQLQDTLTQTHTNKQCDVIQCNI